MSGWNICSIITTKDAHRILQRSYRQAGRMLSKVRRRNGKTSEQPVTLMEFCDFLKMDMADVITVLNEKKKK